MNGLATVACRGLRLLRQLGLGTLVGLGWAAAQQPASDFGAMLQRTALFVQDLDRSVDFYQRIGFTTWWDRSTHEGDSGGVIGVGTMPLSATPKAGRFVVMKGGDPRLGMLGLMAYDEPPLPKARGNLSGLGTGDFFLTIQVPNLQRVYTRLSQIGARFHHTPYRYSLAGPDGKNMTGQSMFVFDPDGHLLELYQPDIAQR